MIIIEGKEYYSKDYFDKDYFETAGYKSGYSKSNMNRSSYLNKAIAVWIVQTLKLGGNERVLEIGCAFGWIIEHLVELYNLDAYGQDISSYSTANAPDNIRHRIRECNDTNIAFDDKFDIVYSLETFEHVPKPLVDEYFTNIYNCMNDNGILLCTICLGHNDNRGTDIDQSHQTLQPRDWWNTKLESAGFTIRKDLEAEAYELGLQTAEMQRGQWLPREYNWHVFVAEKKTATNKPSEVIYDRRLMAKSPNKPTLLILGSRRGDFLYPTDDFFQIDNWGNYLSYYFNAEFKSIYNNSDIAWSDYDLLITALDFAVVDYLRKLDSIPVAKKVCFLDGTLPMMSEKLEHREHLLQLLEMFDTICAHGAGVHDWCNIFGYESRRCSHIFPFRFFDAHYKKQHSDTWTILCAGKFNTEAHLASFSCLLASSQSDKTYMGIDSGQDGKFLRDRVPSNVTLYDYSGQNTFYSQILSNVDLVIKMDNPPGVGRIIAEAAAGQIPAVSGRDLYQIRCFPEVVIDDTYNVEQYLYFVNKLKQDTDFYNFLSVIGRERLKAVNEAEYHQMLAILNDLGFGLTKDIGVYW